MKLDDWLKRENIRPSAFARTIGVTPATVFQLCQNNVWLGKAVGQKIFDATRGEVGPTDFLDSTEVRRAEDVA